MAPASNFRSAQLPLESLADLEAVVVRVPPGAGRAITRKAFEGVEVDGKAVLAAGVSIVEHLCNLGRLPGRDFKFFAVPAKVAGFGSWPVRAFGHVLPSNDSLGLSAAGRSRLLAG